jgi:AraC-like DNA-binding protein/mannose-6-phosphate isomerase-like protein (cupin superfamily)
MYALTARDVDPQIVRRVSHKKWFALLGRETLVDPWTYGYTDEAWTDGVEVRTVPEHVFYFVTDGASEIVFPDRCVPVRRGSFIWIMPGVTHSTRPLAKSEPVRNYWARLKITSPGGRLFRIKEDFILQEDAWASIPYIKQIVDELQAPHPFQAVRLRAVLQLLTSWAIRPTNHIPQRERPLIAQQRVRLIQYIEAHDGNVTPDMLAKVLDLSPAYFSRVFRSAFGVAPKVWIVQQRIHFATVLLASTELSLKEMASRLGYSDFFHFSRQFKQVIGVSPRAYREGLAK